MNIPFAHKASANAPYVAADSARARLANAAARLDRVRASVRSWAMHQRRRHELEHLSDRQRADIGLREVGPVAGLLSSRAPDLGPRATGPLNDPWQAGRHRQHG